MSNCVYNRIMPARSSFQVSITLFKCLRGRSLNRHILGGNESAKRCIFTTGRNPSLATQDKSFEANYNNEKRMVQPSLTGQRSRATIDRAGLERLPTLNVARNLFLALFFSSPLLLKSGLALVHTVANGKSRILSVDSNPLLRAVLKPLLYNHFCAGNSRQEILQTRDTIRRIGFSGVALCYGKEVQAQPRDQQHSISKDAALSDIELWKKGNLETLSMIGSGDWLAMKYTGAGHYVTNVLAHNSEPPAEFVAAMDVICKQAKAQNCRIWVDAEQQTIQKGIDNWTIDFMRRHNRNGKAVVYTTIQAYLKASRANLIDQLRRADQEGWTLAVKLVRGAYIDSEQRSLIHDTKQDTDDCYNGIARDILSGTNLGFPEGHFPRMQLLLAGHNSESVLKAMNLIGNLARENRLKVLPDFAQLQGMGDQLGCSFLQQCAELEADQLSGVAIVPKVYKCLTWGSVQECMQYLLRRAVENMSATDRMRDGMSVYRNELKHRIARMVKAR